MQSKMHEILYRMENNVISNFEFECIEYGGTRYPIRYVCFWNMNVRIATISLEKSLFDEETGLPTSREAESIDETLFYFVQDKEIFLPKHEFLQLLEKQVV